MKKLLSLPSKDTFKELLGYIIPGIAGLIFNSLYIVVDGLMVARMLGRKPLAAVTVGVPVVEILLALSMLISVGAGVMISNEKGQNRFKNARDIFNISTKLLLVISISIMILSLFHIEATANLLGATPEIRDLSTTYLKYFFMFSPTFMFNYALGTWLRNDSKPNLAMIALIFGAVSNIFLDWYFMGPLKMGIAGAALATGLGPIFGIIIMLPHFLLKKGDLYFESVKLNFSIIIDILINGLPAFAMEFALGITALCINLAIGIHIGTLGFATYGIIGYITLIIFSVFLGIGQGSQPLISYYEGSNNKNKVYEIVKINVQISIFIGIISYILLFNYAHIPVSIFSHNDVALAQNAVQTSIYYFPALFISGINIAVASYMQSVGHWKESIIISLSRSLLLLLPTLLILPNFLGKNGVWLSVPIAEFLTLFITYLLWLKTATVSSLESNVYTHLYE